MPSSQWKTFILFSTILAILFELPGRQLLSPRIRKRSELSEVIKSPMAFQDEKALEMTHPEKSGQTMSLVPHHSSNSEIVPSIPTTRQITLGVKQGFTKPFTISKIKGQQSLKQESQEVHRATEFNKKQNSRTYHHVHIQNSRERTVIVAEGVNGECIQIVRETQGTPLPLMDAPASALEQITGVKAPETVIKLTDFENQRNLEGAKALEFRKFLDNYIAATKPKDDTEVAAKPNHNNQAAPESNASSHVPAMPQGEDAYFMKDVYIAFVAFEKEYKNPEHPLLEAPPSPSVTKKEPNGEQFVLTPPAHHKGPENTEDALTEHSYRQTADGNNALAVIPPIKPIPPFNHFKDDYEVSKQAAQLMEQDMHLLERLKPPANLVMRSDGTFWNPNLDVMTLKEFKIILRHRLNTPDEVAKFNQWLQRHHAAGAMPADEAWFKTEQLWFNYAGWVKEAAEQRQSEQDIVSQETKEDTVNEAAKKISEGYILPRLNELLELNLSPAQRTYFERTIIHPGASNSKKPTFISRGPRPDSIKERQNPYLTKEEFEEAYEKWLKSPKPLGYHVDRAWEILGDHMKKIYNKFKSSTKNYFQRIAQKLQKLYKKAFKKKNVVPSNSIA